MRRSNSDDAGLAEVRDRQGLTRCVIVALGLTMLMAGSILETPARAGGDVAIIDLGSSEYDFQPRGSVSGRSAAVASPRTTEPTRSPSQLPSQWTLKRCVASLSIKWDGRCSHFSVVRDAPVGSCAAHPRLYSRDQLLALLNETSVFLMGDSTIRRTWVYLKSVILKEPFQDVKGDRHRGFEFNTFGGVEIVDSAGRPVRSMRLKSFWVIDPNGLSKTLTRGSWNGSSVDFLLMDLGSWNAHYWQARHRDADPNDKCMREKGGSPGHPKTDKIYSDFLRLFGRDVDRMCRTAADSGLRDKMILVSNEPTVDSQCENMYRRAVDTAVSQQTLFPTISEFNMTFDPKTYLRRACYPRSADHSNIHFNAQHGKPAMVQLVVNAMAETLARHPNGAKRMKNVERAGSLQ